MKAIVTLVPTHNSQLAIKTDTFDIKLLSCGYDNNSTSKNFNIQTTNYNIVALLEGSGVLVYADKKFSINPGDIFALPIGIPYATIPKDNSLFKLAYVSFDGAVCETFLKRANLTYDSPVVSTNNNTLYKKICKIYKHLAKQTFNDMIKANITLFEIFYYLFELVEENKKIIKASKNPYVLRAEDYIKDNYKINITIEDIANALFINRSYLSHLFSVDNGISIKHYLINYRLKQSLTMLEDLSLSISEIASQLCFPDFVCFYRQFKKAFNFSPSEYRKRLIADPRYKANSSIQFKIDK